MNSKTSIERGYLLLSDITGFVPFLNESEAEHAHEIIAELLEFTLAKIDPLFNLVQIDGDAIFAQAPQSRILRSETIFELLEATYVAFKDQLLQSSRIHSCQCNACRSIGKLDLKFAVHFGEYIPNKVQNQFDLVGIAPYFIRSREWKESVKETLAWRGYALFTQDCLTQLGLHPDDLSVIEIPGGSVRTFGLNLQARYESMLEQRRVVVTRENAQVSFHADFPVPPSILWSWINDPVKRTQWFILRWSVVARLGGRTAPNAVNHCEHGIGDTRETILDWRPFDYYTSQYHIRPVNIKIQQTLRFESLPNNSTRLHLSSKPAEDSKNWISSLTCDIMGRYHISAFKRLRKMIDASA